MGGIQRSTKLAVFAGGFPDIAKQRGPHQKVMKSPRYQGLALIRMIAASHDP
jgi:hypothetical protein